MGVDEVGTLARLKALLRERIEPLIERHRGRVFKTTGDGVLVEFSSVIDAVGCAALWQSELPEGELRFRIGINLGDVMIEDGDIFGNGVNVAARLETLADSGGICLSGNVYDEVRGKLGLTFEDMGMRTFKNIAEPVRTYRVILDRVSPTEAPKPKTHGSARLGIAVLPFSNLSSGTTSDDFADAITEDIITALSRSHILDVTARNSTFAYKGKSPNIREVARALDVKYVLEGSVRQGGDRARITAQLIEAASGNHVWADRYDRPLLDEFAVQDEIARRVSSILTERIWQDVVRNIGKKDTHDYTIHDYVFRGLELLHRLDPTAMVDAVAFFRKALDLDPDYYLGQIGLGFAHLIYGFWDDPDDEHLAKAHRHGLRLTEIAPESAQTWRLLSRTYCGRGEWDEGWSCVERAISIDPNDGDIIGNVGIYHIFDGNPLKAIECLEQVLSLHSDTPQTVDIMRFWKAMALFVGEDYAAAVPVLRGVSGHDFIKAEILAACYARLGQSDEARAQATAVLSAYPAFNLRAFRVARAFRRPSDRQNLIGALEEAGLPR